jgi:hypothetical protein
MARQGGQDDDEDWDDPEDPDPSDTDPDSENTFWGDTNTIQCPYCDEEIAEEAEWCPHCGKYISKEDAPSHKSVWIVLGFVLVALAMLVWLFSRTL